MTDNIIEGKVGAAMFLGEYLDCAIELGKNTLRPTSVTPCRCAGARRSGSSYLPGNAWRYPRNSEHDKLATP